MGTEAPRESILVAGDTLVDVMQDSRGPVDDETTLEPKFGGAGANVAVGLERIGAPPLYWTRIATDEFGDMLARTVADSGIPNDYVVRDGDAETTLAFVTHDDEGEPRFSFYRTDTADTRMRRGTVPDAALEELDWVHVSGVLLSAESSRTAVLDLMRRAGREGCTVSLDPNARSELWPSEEAFTAVVRGALHYVDVLKATPGDLEAAGFDATDHVELARDVCALGPHTAILTRGGEGSLCVGAEGSPMAGVARHEGYDVDVVDTTGAGDAFFAGAVASMANGVTDAERVLGLGNAVGAVATTRAGSVTALDDAERVRELAGELPWE